MWLVKNPDWDSVSPFCYSFPFTPQLYTNLIGLADRIKIEYKEIYGCNVTNNKRNIEEYGYFCYLKVETIIFSQYSRFQLHMEQKCIFSQDASLYRLLLCLTESDFHFFYCCWPKFVRCMLKNLMEIKKIKNKRHWHPSGRKKYDSPYAIS